MLKVNNVQTNFSSGELSPWLLGRSDIERYQNGAEILENFTVRPQGGITRRLGSKVVFEANEQDETKHVRVLDFIFSRLEANAIEIGAGYFRIHGSGVQFLNGLPVVPPTTVTTVYGTETTIPYLDEHIMELQFTQSADVLFITHPSYPPATLSRYGATDWRYEVPTFEYGPYLDQETDDQNISLTINNVTDRVRLTSDTSGDFTGRVEGDFIEYAYNGQKVLGQVAAVYSTTEVDVEPLEDRSLVLSKEVYSPGLYFGWDATNNIPTYTGTIAGSDVDVAFSAVGVVTQEQIGNYLRFCDRSGTYYWMLVNGVKDILRQGAYGIIANGDILTVHRPTGVVTRGNRRINARLRASTEFFDLDTDANRLFRLVLGNTVVHARGRSEVTYTLIGDNVNGQPRVNLSYEDAGAVLPGDTITGTGIPADTVIVAAVQSEIQSYAIISNNCTNGDAAVTYTVNVSSTSDLGVTLNRAIPRSVEGLTVIQNGTTNDWNRGAWYTGNYPSTVCFHEGRLGLGGSPLQPQTGWLSRTDDIYNFATTDEKLRVFDDAAITFTIASDTVNQILWMQSRQVLLIGTVGSEWKVTSNNIGAPITPTNISVVNQSTYGSELIKPISIGKAALFVQRGARKVREMSYDYQTDSQVSVDLTVFSDHITKDHDGITQIAYQPSPDSVLYALMDDGQVAAFTYEPDQKVYAWTRFVLGGPQAIVESIACVPRSSDVEFTYYPTLRAGILLYMVVRRYINNDWVRTIEYIEPEFRPESATDREQMLFVDGASMIYSSGGVGVPTSHFTGLTEYAGCTVTAVGDEQVWEDLTVSDAGVLDLPTTVSDYCYIGFSYTSTLKTFPIEAPAQAGTGQGKYKRIHKITLRLLDSIDFQHGPDLDNLTSESFRESTNPVDEVPPMFSGDKTVDFADGYDTRGAYYITQDKAYPLTILSLMPEFAQMQ